MRTPEGTAASLFGPLGQALGPRAIEPACTGRGGAGGNTDVGRRAALALNPGGLSKRLRARLEALPGAHLEPAAATTGASRELLFECDASALAELARECDEAALLDAAQKAWERPHGSPLLMGVVNVTPDSFSDGGRFLDPAQAIEQGLALAAEGAAILDVGGESTRPGAPPVSEEVELERVLPVIAGLALRSDARISIDTTKARVARAAVEAGATIVNDVSAGRADPAMLATVASLSCELILMHSRGTPADMQRDPRYGDPVAEVAEELRMRVSESLKAGIALNRMSLDPGIGFGKRLEHNLDLLRRLPELRSLGLPICVGVSRKSFIAHATGRLHPSDWEGNRPRGGALGAGDQGANDRSGGTAAAVALCALAGADFLRVHEVARSKEAVSIALAITARPARPETAMQRTPPTDAPREPYQDQARWS